VEAEGVVRVAQIVVDGLGHSDDVEALLVDQPRGTGQGALTADGDEGIDAVGGHDLTHPVGPTILIGVGAGSAEDGSSATGQTADIEHRHVEHVVLKQTPPPVADPDEGRPVRAHALADAAADADLVSRAVAARGGYTDLRSSCPRSFARWPLASRTSCPALSERPLRMSVPFEPSPRAARWISFPAMMLSVSSRMRTPGGT